MDNQHRPLHPTIMDINMSLLRVDGVEQRNPTETVQYVPGAGRGLEHTMLLCNCAINFISNSQKTYQWTASVHSRTTKSSYLSLRARLICSHWFSRSSCPRLQAIFPPLTRKTYCGHLRGLTQGLTEGPWGQAVNVTYHVKA